MPYFGSAPPENALEAGDIASNAVTTAKIADDAVDITKINLVSTSSVPSLEAKGDGSSDGYIQLNCSQNSHGIKLKSPPHSASQSYTLTFPSSITNDYFLKTDGSGNLSFAEVSSAVTALSTVTASTASTAVSPTLDSTYRTIMVIGSNINMSADDSHIRITYTDASSEKTSSYRWASNIGKSDGSHARDGSNSDSYIQMIKDGGDEAMENNAAQGASFTFYLDNPAATNNYKTCRWIMSAFNTESTPRHLAINGAGQWFGGTSAITSIKFAPSSGTFTGFFEFYGIKGA